MAKDKLVEELVKINISLSKKSTELLNSMNQLNKKMSNILSLFEKAAEYIEKGEVEEPLARKLQELLEQNKQIARGLILLEKYVRDKTTVGFSPSFPPKELPR